MDTRDGRIYTPEQQKQMADLLGRGNLVGMEKLQNKFDNMKKMLVDPTPIQLARKPPRVGRNESCPCGSGKKFKKCCLNNPPASIAGV